MTVGVGSPPKMRARLKLSISRCGQRKARLGEHLLIFFDLLLWNRNEEQFFVLESVLIFIGTDRKPVERDFRKRKRYVLLRLVYHRLLDLFGFERGKIEDDRERRERRNRSDRIFRRRTHFAHQYAKKLRHVRLENLQGARLERLVRAREISARFEKRIVRHFRPLTGIFHLDCLDGCRPDINAEA